jgi:hypothetical protein
MKFDPLALREDILKNERLTANYINHIAIVADASSSMGHLKDSVVKVTDNTVAHLADRSKVHDQETRVTFYTFSSQGREDCVYYDKDVLRMPSVEGKYRPSGMTALVDATLLAIEDLKLTAQKYGEHAFLIYVISDGYENHSRKSPRHLAEAIDALPDNWTLAAFAPDQQAVFALKQSGFPKDNVSVWDIHSVAGIEDVGSVMRTATETFMEGRKLGIRGYNSKTEQTAVRGNRGLFQMRDFKPADVAGAAVPMTKGSYFTLDVPQDERIDEFVARNTGKPYILGRSYYQFMKTETIQPQKTIAVELNGQVYSGPAARAVLGLPTDHSVRVRPDQKPGCTIFVQSTSYNRKLIGGTRVLVLR